MPAQGGLLGQLLQSELHPGVSFRIERTLGQGGTATAFFATRVCRDGETPVVVKVILPRLVLESGAQAETIIKKEAVALGRLNERVPPTPFVVRLLDTGSVQLEYFGRPVALPWIALEYVHGGAEGTTLDARVLHALHATKTGFDPTRLSRLVDALSRGLTEIHAVGVVHRDLTPGNVLCCGSADTEMFKISDFGIARPVGLQATFGDAVVGTPGYVPPEQIGGSAPVSPASDVFSLGAIVYFALTGQRYFDVNSPTQALIAATAPERKSLLASATLAPELREREASCQAIDLALARATAPNPADRPQSAAQFAQSLLPWLSSEAPSNAARRKWLNSLQMLQQDAAVETHFSVRHPPGQDRLLLGVDWNASGNCLAASTEGLVFWDGVRWARVTTAQLDAEPRAVRRLSASSWLVGCERGRLVELAGGDVADVNQAPTHGALSALCGNPREFAIVVAETAGEPPTLHAVVARRWLKPIRLDDAASISSVTEFDDERFLVVGRAREGGCYAARYSPLDWEIERLPVPDGRALLACSSSPPLGVAVAVGTDGALLRVERDGPRASNVEGRPDFSSVAIDVLGNVHAAGAGCLWSSDRRRGLHEEWREASWRAPFISLLAEMGLVTAVTVDGGVIECRSGSLDRTKAAF